MSAFDRNTNLIAWSLSVQSVSQARSDAKIVRWKATVKTLMSDYQLEETDLID